MLKDLYNAYADYTDTLFDDDYTKLKAQNRLVDTFIKYSEEEIKDEITNLESYIECLRTKVFKKTEKTEVKETVSEETVEDKYPGVIFAPTKKVQENEEHKEVHDDSVVLTPPQKKIYNMCDDDIPF